jgi:hypothetical protein
VPNIPSFLFPETKNKRTTVYRVEPSSSTFVHPSKSFSYTNIWHAQESVRPNIMLAIYAGVSPSLGETCFLITGDLTPMMMQAELVASLITATPSYGSKQEGIQDTICDATEDEWMFMTDDGWTFSTDDGWT